MLIPDVELKAKIEEFIKSQGLKRQRQLNSTANTKEALDSSNDATPMFIDWNPSERTDSFVKQGVLVGHECALHVVLCVIMFLWVDDICTSLIFWGAPGWWVWAIWVGGGWVDKFIVNVRLY